MTLKISSPTHPEIDEVFCNKKEYDNCGFEKIIDYANFYSDKFGIPAKIYIGGIYYGILTGKIYIKGKKYTKRK